MSDANKVVDAAPLVPLLAERVRRLDGRTLPRLAGHALPDELAGLTRRLVAADGTFLRVVGELLWTLSRRVAVRGRGGATARKVVSKPRLDVPFDVAAGVPRFVVLSGRDRSESNAARLHVEPGKIYLADKAYFSFKLLSDGRAADADFVVALNSQIRFTPDEAAPASAAADAGHLLSDRLGRLSGCDHSTPPTRPLREVIVRRDDGKPLRLLTSLIDPAIGAETIGELYRRRGTIELFFRRLKGGANFRHVIRHRPSGLSRALYVAIIGTLLTALVTRRRPGKHVLASLSFVAAGMATWEDLQPVLEQFERERTQARARDAAKRARTRAPKRDRAAIPL
jgi:hypothetical protein